MGKTYLVKIFCEVNLDKYDKAIGESFTKLAFEAVEKIINVSLIRQRLDDLVMNRKV